MQRPATSNGQPWPPCGAETALVVAHRLSQAEGADAIAVLIHGRLVELGTHDELLARNGAYATSWTAWAARGVQPPP